MYKCVGLDKKSILEFRKLSDMSHDFNALNEEFFAHYLNYSFAGQIRQRRRVKLLKKQNLYIGFVWIENISMNSCIIRALFSMDKENIDSYKALLESVDKCQTFLYSCRRNEYNFEVLEKLGFQKYTGEIELSLSGQAFEAALGKREAGIGDLNFKTFRIAKDEGLRCYIQNKIFEDEGRTPICLADILYDVSRSYYVKGGSFFLYKGYDCIGYGQIIINNGNPYIVNLGIIEEYRGKGYSKVLLLRLLEKIKEMGYNNVRLTVKSENEAALKLYWGFGFKNEYETYIWRLNKDSS
ncbi:MAG: GNAT family N-acetyltransferase [Clostridiaceae bacterium]